MAGDSSKPDDIVKQMEELSLISFRKIDEVKRLAKHLSYVINHPKTQESPLVCEYLKRLNEFHKKTFLSKKETVVSEYVYCPEGRKEQRQRFNSLTVNEMTELLKFADWIPPDSKHEHFCVECNCNIDVNDDEPLMECLTRHFSLGIHRPRSVSVDVSEPIKLPTMSRRKSALDSAAIKLPAVKEKLESIAAPHKQEKIDKNFQSKLETVLMRVLADNSEEFLDSAVKIYQNSYDNIVNEIAKVNLTNLKSTVTPIIMSIKDNVIQNYAGDENKNFENDDGDKSATQDKTQSKKQRYYGQIESEIINLLKKHKIISLVDERTGKPAFFCICCEYYTLRFKYDSILNHVFSNLHMHNLASILSGDLEIPSGFRNVEQITESNLKFLNFNYVNDQYECSLCNVTFDSLDQCLIHILDEGHLGKLSDELYKVYKVSENNIPAEWGKKSLDWSKHLSATNKNQNFKDYLLSENFIKPTAKFSNYCPGCDMTLKGPRQLLFSHVRQKKHLRNAAPLKLQLLYKNYCRPIEYFGSFGNFYACYLCQNFTSPSLGSMMEHIESDHHLEIISKYLKSAQTEIIEDKSLLDNQFITYPNLKCSICNQTFSKVSEAVQHILGSLEHGNLISEKLYKLRKYDIIEVYMKERTILHNEGSTFNCTSCNTKFASLRSLLMHLVYSVHIKERLNPEIIFRFYLELKYNINMMIKNKYSLLEFGKVKCGVCDSLLQENDNVKKHVMYSGHRERMGIKEECQDEQGMNE